MIDIIAIAAETIKRALYLTGILLLMGWSASGTAHAQAFFQPAAGIWYGTLEYSDYQTNQRVTLTTLLTITPEADGNSATFTYLFDDFGKVFKSTETHRIDRVAKKYYIDGAVYSLEEAGEKLVLLGHGLDNDRDEPFRETLAFGSDTLSFLKETRSPFQFRHRYDFQRSREYHGAPRTFSPAEMAEDIAVLKQVLLKIHPGTYRYVTPEQLERKFAELLARASRPLPEGKFFELIAQTISFIKCGHTYLNPLNQAAGVRETLLGRRSYLPFYFRLIDRRMIVTGNVSSKTLSLGSEIVKLNDIPVSQIVDSLLSVTASDGENTVSSRLKQLEVGMVEENRDQLFDYFFPLFYPLPEPVFTVEAIDRETKKAVKFKVLALTKAERRARTETSYGKSPTYDDGWKFTVESECTAYLRIGNFLTWRLKSVDPKRFLAEAFRRLRAEGIRHLIIDLRGNGGGDTDTGYELVRYLAPGPLPPYLSGRRLVRNVSAQPELVRYLKTYSPELLAELTNGIDPQRFRQSRPGYFAILPRPDLESYPAVAPYPDRFWGKVYLITDPSNASAAFQLVDYVRTHRLATIVGQETGGNRQGINGGNFYFLTLPNSKFEIDIPVYFQSPLKPANDGGVVPDRLVRISIEDIASVSDPELSYVKGLIRSAGSGRTLKQPVGK